MAKKETQSEQPEAVKSPCRQWLYRKGEQRLFAKGEVVPDPETWSDKPVE